MNTQIEKSEEKIKNTPIIKVIGVGGGGGNAVNYMKNQGIIDVDFFVCNTDAQALEKNSVENKISIGNDLTDGRGAGNDPAIGKNAAIESEEQLTRILSENTKMLFVTAGMGGGTGTGAAPIIASIARKLGILTIGIVTIPFKFEGKLRLKQAIEGLEEMEKHVDSLLVIDNEKLREIHGDQKISEAFNKADDVLLVAAKGIAEIITVHGHVNVDFADVCTVMRDSGVAILGSACASGPDRGIKAIQDALNSPLLNTNNIQGAKNILLNVSSGSEEFRLDELGEITEFVHASVGADVQIIWGNSNDESLDNKIRVVIIATGFQKHNVHEIFAEKKKNANHKVITIADIPQNKTIKEPTKAISTKEKEAIKKSDSVYNLKDEEKKTEKIKTVKPKTTKELPQQREKTYQQPKKKKKSSKKKNSEPPKIGDWIQKSLDFFFNED